MGGILALKLIRSNDTQFADFAAIFIRKNIYVCGMSMFLAKKGLGD
jgi:hypothetical protein